MRRGTRWRLPTALLVGALMLWLWYGEPDVNGRELPLIFIGGVPRSGTTLMSAKLDAHPDVRCGQETRMVPRILQMRQYWMRSQKERVRLEQAGVSKAVLDNAIAAFCLEVIVRHGGTAPRLCNRDPLVLKMSTYVLELFPNAKFLFMVRDGRATVHTIITRKVTITGFNLTSYRQCLTKWNHTVKRMYQQCTSMKPKKCLVVRYEALVLRPHATMRRVLSFLQLPWNDAVLHHDTYINQRNDITLSNVERSSDQKVRLMNLDALDEWVGQIPEDVRADMEELAPMLSQLDYDPWANPPRYDAMDNVITERWPP